MKLIKTALLAATAAAAASALVGASTASAESGWIGLCKAQELLNCTEANLVEHPLQGSFLLLAGAGYFESSVKVKCESGHGETNLVESQQSFNFKSNLEELSFEGCTGCPTVEVGKEQPTSLNMTETTGDWRLKAENATVTFKGCFGFLTCKYEGNLDLSVQMDEEGAYADPAGQEFELVEGSGLCGNTGKWEEGRTRVDWVLDDAEGTLHTEVWPSLIGEDLVPTTTDAWIAICKASELSNCAKNYLAEHPLQGSFLLLAGAGYFESSVKVECESGHGETNLVESQSNKTFNATLEELTFAGCVGCKVSAILPQALTLDMAKAGSSHWRLKATGAKVKFTGCFGFLNCEYEGDLNFLVQMDEEGAYADPEGAKLEQISGSELCGEIGKWEEGRTRFDWVLDDAEGTLHTKVWPSLIGANLIDTTE